MAHPSGPDVLAACGCERRREILRVLAHGPCSVGALADGLDLDVSLISHHLRHLREADLVDAEQDRHRRLYRLGPRCTLGREGVLAMVYIRAQEDCWIVLAVPGLTLPPAAAAPARPGSAC